MINGYDFDEYRFNEVQEIIFHLQRLKSKYGYSMDDLYSIELLEEGSEPVSGYSAAADSP